MSSEIGSLRRVTITLGVDDRQVLYLQLDRAGGVRRQGSGTLDETSRDLDIGAVEPSVFEALATSLPADLARRAGRYSLPHREGPIAALEIRLEGDAGETGFAFRYDAGSVGPPEEIRGLVARAVELTDPWFRATRSGSTS